MQKLLAVFILIGLMLSGCVYVDMNVVNKPEPGFDMSTVHTFAYKKSNDSKSDLEAVLLKAARVELEAKGFVYDVNSPEFLVIVNFSSKAVMERGVTYKRDSYNYDYLSNSYTDIGVVKASDADRNDNIVRLYMVTPENEGLKTFLWRGSASSQGQEGVDVFGKCLVKGALLKFPAANGSFREKLRFGTCE
ncbi:protein of unknown function [Maridesulfovibrio ferrireducens]|uniref:DUF4136 domain-containing protein n=1 Tax=Maridesulfovibrio ferrireducens TaxID=246191 RepID=A0A1G9G203_9BACT|nr:DUF4136 domain-containing protein [Maridesulfovibrio ferrireducens]SDK94690.1 protein of unknown function [Maridesulfovibrio ferrireducens]